MLIITQQWLQNSTFSLSPVLNLIMIAKRLMRFPSSELTMPYFCLSEGAINILSVITNGDYANDINYHYFQLLHSARPCRLWGQLPAEEPPPAAVHSLAEPTDCVTVSLCSVSLFLSFLLPRLVFVSSVTESIAAQKLCIQSRMGQCVNEERWKLIVGRLNVSCEEIINCISM